MPWIGDDRRALTVDQMAYDAVIDLVHEVTLRSSILSTSSPRGHRLCPRVSRVAGWYDRVFPAGSSSPATDRNHVVTCAAPSSRVNSVNKGSYVIHGEGRHIWFKQAHASCFWLIIRSSITQRSSCWKKKYHTLVHRIPLSWRYCMFNATYM